MLSRSVSSHSADSIYDDDDDDFDDNVQSMPAAHHVVAAPIAQVPFVRRSRPSAQPAGEPQGCFHVERIQDFWVCAQTALSGPLMCVVGARVYGRSGLHIQTHTHTQTPTLAMGYNKRDAFQYLQDLLLMPVHAAARCVCTVSGRGSKLSGDGCWVRAQSRCQVNHFVISLSHQSESSV